MYYRVAYQGDASSPWQWKSTALSSLGILLQWLQFYRAFPRDRLRIFSSCSREALNEQLLRENQGLLSTSLPATQFLQARGITSPGAVGEACASESRANGRTTTIPAETSPSPDASCMSSLDKRREELERGAGGDHDQPYRFTLPIAMPQVLAWVKLLARVERVRNDHQRSQLSGLTCPETRLPALSGPGEARTEALTGDGGDKGMESTRFLEGEVMPLQEHARPEQSFPHKRM